MTEFFRIPTTALLNVPTGEAAPNLVGVVKAVGRTVNPVIVVAKGRNPETYEPQYEIVLNGAMAEAARLAGLETVDAFVIDAKDIEAVAKMF